MKRFTILFIAIVCHFSLHAQQAVDPLGKITAEITQINKKFVEYQSTMAHSDNPKKTEQKRQALLNQVQASRAAIAKVPPYQNDMMLQNGMTEYLKIVEYSMNEDYAQLVNMKEIAEQSYDKMEMYMQIKDQVAEKMEKAGDEMSKVQKDYCKKYNITLVESQSELEKQIEVINQVSKYYDKVQLVFLKCSFIDEDLGEAIKKENVNETEQLRSALQKTAEEGMRVLDTMQAFKGDRSLINACKKTMGFFQQQATRSADFTDLFTQQENFKRIKQQFDADKSNQNDKDAIKKYNDAVDAMNKAVNNTNKTADYLNKTRQEAYDNWNNANKLFLDKHVPVV